MATRRSPAPIANRISVAAGENEMMRSGTAAISTAVPDESVIVSGKAFTGRGAAVVVAAGPLVVVAARVPDR